MKMMDYAWGECRGDNPIKMIRAKGIASAQDHSIKLFFDHRRICKCKRVIARDQAAYSFIAKSITSYFATGKL